MLPLYKWTHNLDETKPKEILLPHPEFDKPNEHHYYSTNNEEEMNRWKPGKQKGSVESTPAFKPFSTKSGRILTRWIAMLLKTRWTKQGKPTDIDFLQNLSKDCNIRSRPCIEMMKDMILEIAGRNPLMTEKEIVKMFEDYGDIDDNSSQESLEDDVYVKFHDENPHVNDCRALLTIITSVTESRCKLKR